MAHRHVKLRLFFFWGGGDCLCVCVCVYVCTVYHKMSIIYLKMQKAFGGGTSPGLTEELAILQSDPNLD